jgi:hypothetical protein
MTLQVVDNNVNNFELSRRSASSFKSSTLAQVQPGTYPMTCPRAKSLVCFNKAHLSPSLQRA